MIAEQTLDPCAVPPSDLASPVDTVNDNVTLPENAPIDTRLSTSSDRCLDKQNEPQTGYAQTTSNTDAPSVWRRAWITPTSIVGFYTAALLCAIAHLCFFNHLDGRLLHRSNDRVPFPSTDLPQSYVTTISLLLVTAFRAALVAAIGVCYTQYLWQDLRRHLMEVGVIEELFQIRANALRLFNLSLLQCAPTLLTIAVISWLIPIATIYPPGALIVKLEMYGTLDQLNASVLPSSGKLAYKGRMLPPPEDALRSLGIVSNSSESQCGPSNLCIGYNGTSQLLGNLAKVVLASGRTSDLANPSGGNTTYTLTFPGPMMQCQESKHTNTSVYNSSALFEPGFAIMQAYSMFRGNIVLIDSPSEDWMSISPCPERNQSTQKGIFPPDEGMLFFQSYTRTECNAATAEYNVNITFTSGRQTLEYSVGKVSQLTPYKQIPWGNLPSDWDFAPLQSWQEHVNILSLVESLLSNIEGMKAFNRMRAEAVELADPDSEPFRLPNGTLAEACPSRWPSYDKKYTSGSSMEIFGLSPLSKAPFTIQNSSSPRFFNMSEDILNTALANITISALSLNLWQDTINGTAIRPYNVYYFQRKLNLFLPYGLCLLITLPIMILGLMALRNNGVSAIDGGFVQVLMTAATGGTELEMAASKASLGGHENVPKDLTSLKVRFGELLRVGEPLQYAKSTDAASLSSEREAVDAGVNEPGEDISLMLLSQERRADDPVQLNRAAGEAEVASGAERCETAATLARRAGFGVLHETKPLQRGNQLDSSLTRYSRELSSA